MDLTLPNASKLGGSVCIFFTQTHFFTTWLEINVRSHFSALSCNFKKQNWGINSQLKSNAAITKMQPTVRRCIASCCILTAVAVTWPADAFPVKWAVKQISGWNARARRGKIKEGQKKEGQKKWVEKRGAVEEKSENTVLELGQASSFCRCMTLL